MEKNITILRELYANNKNSHLYLMFTESHMHFHYIFTYCHFPCLIKTKEKLISHLYVMYPNSDWKKIAILKKVYSLV